MTESEFFSGNERFELLSVLGKGGMSIVYEAYDRHLGRKVALKTLCSLGGNELYRLKTEFRVLQEMEHPNLVSLGELFEDRGRWFFTMELVRGVDILTYVRGLEPPGFFPSDAGRCKAAERRMPFDEGRLRDAFSQLASALEVIHSHQRVHRDIKPANILVQADGRLVLLDFGLVTQVEPGLQSVDHQMPVGTITYMAPEQAASMEITPKADWYSFGVLLFEALAGRPPFSGTYNQLLLAKRYNVPPNPRDIVPGIPEDLADLAMALMSYNAAARPGAREVRRVLKRDGFPVVIPETAAETHGPIFIGRDREIGRILETFQEVRENGFRALLVEGASGLGKSELLRMAGRLILDETPGAIVLWGRCNERESVSFKAFDGVVDALSRNLLRLSERELGRLTPMNVDLLTRVFPVLSCLNDPGAPLSRRPRQEYDPQEVRSLAFTALREHLSLLADLHPVVVIIDDIQWADKDSIQLLRALTQPPDPPAILLVMSMRTNPDAENDSDAGEWLSRLPFHLERMQLEPLPPDASCQLAQELMEVLPIPPGAPLPKPEHIALEAGGHPLFIQELVQHLTAAGGKGTLQGRLKLDDVLWARVRQLEPELAHLVELACVSFGPLRQDAAGFAMGVSPAEVFRMATRLKILRLVRTTGPGVQDVVEPYHDRVREAVLARMDPEVKKTWHRALVRVLSSARHVEPERLAEHLAAIGEREEAARMFVAAADHAAEKLAFDRAAGLYERAVHLLGENLPEDHPQIRDLNLRLGNALANAGRGKEASRALLDAVRGARAAEALDIKRRAAEQLMYCGFIDEGLAVLEEVLRLIGERVPRTAFGRLVGLMWQRLMLRLRGISYQERDETQIPRVDLVHTDILKSLTMGVGGANVLLASYSCVRLLRQALRIGETARIFFGLCMEANLVSANNPESAYLRRLMAECEKIQKNWKGPRLPYIETAYSFAHFMRGSWAESRRYTQSALRIIDEHGGMFWERGMMNNNFIWASFYLGEIDAMEHHAQMVLRDARNRGDLFSMSGMVLGLGNFPILNREGPQRAAHVIDEILRQWSVDGYHLQHYWALLARANIEIFLGRPERALESVQKDWGRLRNHLLMLIPAVRNESRFLRGRAALSLAAREKGERKRELFRRVLEDCAKLFRQKLPWTQATGLLLAAGAQLEERPEEAVASLRKSLSLLEECSMRLYAAAVRIRLGQLLGGDEGRRMQDEGFAYMKSQNIRNPPAMLEILAPGFG